MDSHRGIPGSDEKDAPARSQLQVVRNGNACIRVINTV
jgi:hypothetical protein